ncbi:lytic polysaccharide monooxygenase [Paenibacillus sp. GSMTC-2017]|uniref:lytic polysaccharide monooxygenase n=1 Tax=Paenibacillus sp. GSMTC-2017 TaxID=2794350 RepID=UPI0018D6BE46|nr:lytic polysaccharide monooxygenase [Paenibacillus sp. GSMTC-2017]MBH5316229.1 lytic polysaccharide monooxygenase [Paenibacillus sp. GSMTC-2017]
MNQIRLNSSLKMRALIACGCLLLIVAIMLIFAKPVSAHGYVDSPASRAIQCKNGLNTNCGAIVNEPQSLEGLKNFPTAGPADGKIASAGLAGFSNLDAQTATRWNKVAMSSGTNTFTWKFTAPHATTSYRYFITKVGWNPNAPLTRAQLDLTPFCTVQGNGQAPPTTLSHSCNVPARTGYHIILAVWDISNTPNAWYIAIDAQFGPSGPTDTTAPTIPTSLAAGANVGTTTASLSWNASTDANGVSGYEIFNGSNPTPIATVSGNQTNVNLTNLLAGTTYNLSVKAYDAAGNRSAASNSVQITTLPQVNDTTPPSNPTGLHVMGPAGSNSLTLMWNASTDANGISGYRIYSGANIVATVVGPATQKLITGLTPNTTYTFTVRALDPSNNVSGNSNAITVTTPQGPTATPWAVNTAYATNTLVSYNGATYKCLQPHTSQAGWEPSNVASLWQLQP